MLPHSHQSDENTALLGRIETFKGIWEPGTYETIALIIGEARKAVQRVPPWLRVLFTFLRLELITLLVSRDPGDRFATKLSIFGSKFIGIF